MIIEIVPYRASWPDEFATLAAALRTELGSLAGRIDHIGSTAVAGLGAKDCLDIQVTVSDFPDFAEVEKVLSRAGYIHVPENCSDHVPAGADPDESQWQKRFFRPPATSRRANIHVRLTGRANQRYALLFRDFLRSHRDVASAYERIKGEIAQRHAADIESYVAIKDPVCDLIMLSAEEWAGSTSWQPDEPDA